MSLPGSSFLEKDGPFTNGERRISRVRKVMAPRSGVGVWETTCLLSEAPGYSRRYAPPSEIMDEIAASTPTLAGYVRRITPRRRRRAFALASGQIF